MRITTTAMTRTVRKALTTVALGAAVVGFAALGTGTAAAETVTATGCGTVVAGQPGEVVTLRGQAVSEYVRKGAAQAKSLVLVHDLTIWPNTLANKISRTQLVIGTVPNAKRATIGGEAIAKAVREELKGSLGLGLLPSTQQVTLDAISKQLAQRCVVPVTSAAAAPPGAQRDQSDQSANRPQGSALPSGVLTDILGGTPLGAGAQPSPSAPAPMRDYGDIPVATPPGANIGLPPELPYPPKADLPGMPKVPQAGILGGGGSDNAANAQDMHSAGEVHSLAMNEPAEAVQLPMLIAVVAVAGVTAALVRTWVLRKAS